jgi:peptidoglycan hydrolase-like protein with peptidoglycan-binding domain
VANVSYLRESGSQRARGRGQANLAYPSRRRGPSPYAIGGIVVLVAVLVAAGILLTSSKPGLATDPSAIAKVTLPLGGGTIESVSAVTGPNAKPVPVVLRNDRIYPRKLLPAGERLNVQVVVARPGWISWLSGGRQRLSLNVTTPVASLRSHYVTVGKGSQVSFQFASPVSEYAYGPSPGQTRRQVLSRPTATVSIPRSAPAGSVYLSAAPRPWESGQAVAVSWFPAGSGATAVASPAPGTKIKSDQPITLTFSTPVSRALGSNLPPVSPATRGTWHTLNGHTIQFDPSGYGYGLGATVKVGLPSAVHIVGGQQSRQASSATWSVPAGSTLRLQQILATLGYLPVNFTPTGQDAALTPQAQEAAAVNAPSGRFSMRYPNTPSWLVQSWQAGSFGELTKGAVMAFENSVGMAPDGVAGPQVWNALINAVIRNQRSTFGYTVADVSEGSPETLTLWHSGHTVLTTPVNTGIPQAPTAQGTFAVFEHLPVTTMSGTNPDGSHYSDPGIPWTSYFNGGDALHGFIRGSYGTPQSLGCVEMPFATAGKVYPYTPIGTIVHVT